MQGLLGIGGQYPHPRLDGHPHALGYPQLFHARPVPASVLVVQLPAFHQRLAHFFDEKRVAFGFAVDAIQKLGCDLLGKQDRQQLPGLGTIQLGQIQPSGQPLAVEIQQHLVERPRLVQLHFAVGGDDHHPLAAGVAGQVAQQEQRAAVGPVGVFQNHQQRCVIAQRGIEDEQVLKQALLRGLGIQRRACPACPERGRGERSRRISWHVGPALSIVEGIAGPQFGSQREQIGQHKLG